MQDNGIHFYSNLNTTTREGAITALINTFGSVAYKRFVVNFQVVNIGFYVGLIAFTSNQNNYFGLLAKRGNKAEVWNCLDGTFSYKEITVS